MDKEISILPVCTAIFAVWTIAGQELVKWIHSLSLAVDETFSNDLYENKTMFYHNNEHFKNNTIHFKAGVTDVPRGKNLLGQPTIHEQRNYARVPRTAFFYPSLGISSITIFLSGQCSPLDYTGFIHFLVFTFKIFFFHFLGIYNL